MPTWSLAITYWLHLMATVVWLGGLAMLILAALPNNKSTAVFERLERRFRPYAHLSLAILLVTGLIQMSADDHYEGFLKINSVWSIGLLAKHIVIGAMIVVSAVLQWSVYPALERARLLARRADADPNDKEPHRRRLRQLTIINFALGVIVLALTAVITAL